MIKLSVLKFVYDYLKSGEITYFKMIEDGYHKKDVEFEFNIKAAIESFKEIIERAENKKGLGGAKP